MTAATFGKRIAFLESLVKGQQSSVVCIPMTFKDSRNVQLAPGIFISQAYTRHNCRTICYTERALLDAWLSKPEQAKDMQCIYAVLSNAECEAIRTELQNRI